MDDNGFVMPKQSTRLSKLHGVWLFVIVAIIGLAWFTQRPSTTIEPRSQPSPTEVSSTESPNAAAGNEDDSADVVIRGVTLREQSGRVLYRGDIDLQPVLDRIAAGKRLDEFPHDGSTFQNRERRLPRKSSGYYREYVVPTPGVRGPGPQRVVVGEAGEVFYTSDHYKSFRRIQ